MLHLHFVICRCTPPEKISTLSSATLRLTAHARDQLSHWAEAVRAEALLKPACVQPAFDPSGSGSTAAGAVHVGSNAGLEEFDFLCRTGQGCWITARHAFPRQTLVAMSEAPAALPEAAAHVHRLYDTVAKGHYAGV